MGTNIFKGKKNVLFIIILTAMIFCVGLYLQNHPRFETLSQRLQTKSFPKLNPKKKQDLFRPTGAAYEIARHMSDVAIDDRNIDLRELIPESVTMAPNLLRGAGFQVNIGDETGIYQLHLAWNADSEHADISLVLHDDKLRPVHAWRGKHGRIDESIKLPGGTYRLSLSCNGKLGSKYRFFARAKKVGSKKESAVNGESIPAFHMQLSLASLNEWKWLCGVARKKLMQVGADGRPGDFMPKNTVKGNLIHQNTKSRIGISLSGVGDIGHFSEKTPSFTVRVFSGPLVFGMKRFKLYSINNKEGLLDYVASSIMRDEEIFVPRWVMVRLYINESYSGIYFVEERYSPELFAGLERYEGEVYGFTHHIPVSYYSQPLPRIYYSPKTASSILPETPPYLAGVFVHNVDTHKFAKTLAFATRYHTTHGLNHADFRYYRNPLLNEFEPMVRDTDVNMWGRNEGVAFLIHSAWWFGKRPAGIGTHYNRKVYPDFGAELKTAYTQIPTTIGLSDLSPGIRQFLSDSENRERFEKFLFYASSSAFRKRFLQRLHSTFAAAEPYLGEAENWVKKLIEGYEQREFIVPKLIPFLVDRSYLIIVDEKNASNRKRQSNSLVYYLYNLSCFTTRITLPEYASVVHQSNHSSGKTNSSNYLLSPSIFYPMIDAGYLNQKNVGRLMQIEQLRYVEESSIDSIGNSPIIKVVIPEDKQEDFRSFMKTRAERILGGTFRHSARKTIFASALPDSSDYDWKQSIDFTSTRIFPGRTNTPKNKPVSELIVFPVDAVPTAKGYRLRYLITNNSLHDLEIDLSKIHITFGAPYGKFVCDLETVAPVYDRSQAQVSAWRIFSNDLEPHDKILSLGAALSAEKSSLIWYDTFWGILEGPSNPAVPNTALVQFDIPTDNQLLYYITEPKVFQNAIVSGEKTDVVVHEYCVNLLHPHDSHEQWNRGEDKYGDIDDEVFTVAREENSNISKIRFRHKYNVISSLLKIPAGYRFEIDKGTTIRFTENGGILSFSPIKAIGTKTERILFTADRKGRAWRGIAIVKATEESQFKYVKISYPAGGTFGDSHFFGGFSVLESSVALENFEVENAMSDDAVHLYKSWFSISDLNVRHSRGDGLDVDWGFGRISNSEFNANAGDNLDLSGSNVMVENCKFENAGDKGISIGEGSVAHVRSSRFRNNKIGVAIKDQSIATIEGCDFGNNTLNGAVYIKKPTYSYPVVIFKECNFKDNEEKIVYEPKDLCTSKYN